LFPKISFAQGNKRVVMVVLDNLSAGELTEAAAPSLRRIAEEGAVGLMNCRTAGSLGPSDTYLCIGAGAKIKGGSNGGLAFNASDIYFDDITAADVFFQRTGKFASPQNVINLAIAEILRNAELVPRSAFPGALGQSLKEAGFKVAVLGNADTKEEHHREVSLIAMDWDGIVQRGDVGSTFIKKDPRAGLVTDYDKLLSRSIEFLRSVDFLVIELGDTSRAEKEALFYAEEAMLKNKTAAIARADNFIGRLSSNLKDEDEETMLMVLAPTTSLKARESGNYLTPLIIGGGGVGRGILTSATTRWPGIIDNTDIAPTVLNFLGADSLNSFSGRPISVLNREEGFENIGALSEKFEMKAQTRVPILTSYVSFVAVMLILAALLSLIKSIPKKVLRGTQLVFLWLLSVPVAFEIFAPVQYGSIVVPIVSASVIAALILLGARFLKKELLAPIVAISLLTTFVLVADVFSGWNLTRGSLLGYCPNIGARFYGIGNEYMGILLGSSIVGTTALLDIRHLNSKGWRLLTGLFFLFLIVAVGHPSLGANMGGAIAAVVAYGTTFLILWEGSLKKKHLAYVVVGILIILLLFTGIDLLRGDSSSHAGRSATLVYRGGATEAVKIIQRKIAMNYKGMRYTAWTRVLLATLLAFPILFLRPVSFLENLRKRYPNLMGGFVGTTLGALAAFVFNDTGAAAAAAVIMFAIVALLYVVVEEHHGSVGDN